MTKGEWNLIKAISSTEEIQQTWALAMRLEPGSDLEFDIKADTSMDRFTVIHVKTNKQLEYPLRKVIELSYKIHHALRDKFN